MSASPFWIQCGVCLSHEFICLYTYALTPSGSLSPPRPPSSIFRFASISIVVNYIFVITFTPAILVISERHYYPCCMRVCPKAVSKGCCGCTRARLGFEGGENKGGDGKGGGGKIITKRVTASSTVTSSAASSPTTAVATLGVELVGPEPTK
jgi:hypothetical protein